MPGSFGGLYSFFEKSAFCLGKIGSLRKPVNPQHRVSAFDLDSKLAMKSKKKTFFLQNSSYGKGVARKLDNILLDMLIESS
jgi:hypothetical protein